MSHRAALKNAMPAMLLHEGVWVGEYRRLDASGLIIDQHAAQVTCEFPDDGPYAYIQHNVFTWPDGRTFRATLPGVLRGERLYWDVDTFRGSAWQSEEDTILLRLFRKDMVNSEFTEIIVLAPDGRSRARTWHWFQDGRLVGRTLCDEYRAD